MLEIVLVEDDFIDVMAIQRMLKKNQVINPLHLAGNGLEALDLIRIKTYKLPIIKNDFLILLDFFMPQMNGIEFLIELQINPNFKVIPVIIFNNSDQIKIAMEKSYFNIIGCVAKPINFSELNKIVKFDILNQQIST